MSNDHRIMAAAPAFGTPGDIKINTQSILNRVYEAKKQGAYLLVMPELCLTGGNLGYLLRQKVLQEALQSASRQIASQCQGMLCIFGLPVLYQNILYNTLALVNNGNLIGFVIKKHLSGEECKTFSNVYPPSIQWCDTDIPCQHVAWLSWPGSSNNTIQVRFFHDLVSPFTPLCKGQILALSSREPAIAGHERELPTLLARKYAPNGILAYANAGINESTTDLVYSGLSFITNNGELISFAPPFSTRAAIASGLSSPILSETDTLTNVVYDQQMPYAPADKNRRKAWCQDCITIAAHGLAIRMKRIGARAVTLGVSGGLDSTMALLTTVQAFKIQGLDKSNIHSYSLPAFGTSRKTRRNATALMKAFGICTREIDLKSSLLQHFQDICQPEDQLDVVYENAQARERTQVLMDLANQVDGLMVGSVNLSELALGFTTFGGDHMSMYSVNAGLYKTAIRLILQQTAIDTDCRLLREVLHDILDTPISPELLPTNDGFISQRTESILGPYLLNDFFLYHFLVGQLDPVTIRTLATKAFLGQIEQDEINKRLRIFLIRFFNNQFKRNCLPEGPQVLGVSLSPRSGYSFPSDTSSGVWLDALMDSC